MINYVKPECKISYLTRLEPISAGSGGDFPMCKTCGFGVDVKEPTNEKCMLCKNVVFPSGRSQYDACQQK